jgi:PTH1 family peptidyl-tRNA hydrolase
MKLVVGLGNPGRQYDGTRHNLGFAVVDRLAARCGAALERERFGGRFAKCTVRGIDTVLLEPMRFMNLSGDSVVEAATFFKIEPADLLVIADDINLKLGTIRIRPGGSAGGHNGLDDCIRALGTADFARLRIGVGPFDGADATGFVLGRFTSAERKTIEPRLDRAAEAAECWIEHGTERAAGRFNGPAPDTEDGTNAAPV